MTAAEADRMLASSGVHGCDRLQSSSHLLLVERDEADDLSVHAVCPLPDGQQKACATWEPCGCGMPDDEQVEDYDAALDDLLAEPCSRGGGRHECFEGELHVAGARCWLVHDAELQDGVLDFDATVAAGTYEVRYTVEDGYGLIIEDLTAPRQAPVMTAPNLVSERAGAASGARLSGREWPNLPGCIHCGAPIRTVNFALGPDVEHYNPDASGRDNTWRYCRSTVATMPHTKADPAACT